MASSIFGVIFSALVCAVEVQLSIAFSSGDTACPIGTTVRFFMGVQPNHYQYVGSPVLGRIACIWDDTQDVATRTCPFYMRSDDNALEQDVTKMTFFTIVSGMWDCGGPAQSVGLPKYCWFTSSIVEGPSFEDIYKVNVANGDPVPAYNYMVYLGTHGASGICRNASGSCATDNYECEAGRIIKPGETFGVGGCQSRFCDPDAVFSQGCCSPVCAGSYGTDVVTGCPRGTFGGVYDAACAGYTCTEATDQSACCRNTEACVADQSVMMFGEPLRGDFVDAYDSNNNVIGLVHCTWPSQSSPPLNCPFYPRTSPLGATPAFAATFSGYKNCALTSEGQSAGTRYCWKTATIEYGPTLLGKYNVLYEYVFNGITSSQYGLLDWYKLMFENQGGKFTSCNQNDVNCGFSVYACTGGSYLMSPPFQYGTGSMPWSMGYCQARYCDHDSFLAGCCRTTTTTTSTSNTTITTNTTSTTSTSTTTTNTTTTTTGPSTTSTNTSTFTTTTSTTSTTSTTTTSTTTTLNLTLFGDDPVTWFGNESKEFWLPIGVLLPVMHTKEFTMLGSTFQGNIYEQWFDRIVINGPDQFQLAAVTIKKDLVDFNRSKAKKRKGKNGFETIDFVLGAEDKPLEVMPETNSFFRRWDVHIGISKIDEIFQYGPHLRTQATIGGARREVVQLRCKSAHILILSSPATEYFGDHSYLAAKYAHLDVVILEMTDTDSLRGILPELWGFRPLSNRTKALLTPPWSKNETLNSSNSTTTTPDAGNESCAIDGYEVCNNTGLIQTDIGSVSDANHGHEEAFL